MENKESIDITEIAKFNAMAKEWWDPKGNSRPLHELNPIRLQFITDRCSLNGKTVLDIGCGGGILSESLAKQGAIVTGIDAAEEMTTIAQEHASQQTISPTHLTYACTTAEAYAEQHPSSFDIITCMELIEHVPNPALLMQSIAILLKPNGQLFLSTLNRTFKSYLLAIVGAEYCFNLLPKGTHDYQKFIRPAELDIFLKQAGLSLQELSGLSYNPLTHFAKLTQDVSVNFLAYATHH